MKKVNFSEKNRKGNDNKYFSDLNYPNKFLLIS